MLAGAKKMLKGWRNRRSWANPDDPDFEGYPDDDSDSGSAANSGDDAPGSAADSRGFWSFSE